MLVLFVQGHVIRSGMAGMKTKTKTDKNKMFPIHFRLWIVTLPEGGRLIRPLPSPPLPSPSEPLNFLELRTWAR